MITAKSLKPGAAMDAMTADYLMDSSAVAFESADRCSALMVSMVKDHAGSVPIVDEGGRVVGIVTEFDLLRAIGEGVDLTRTAAGQVMTRDPIMISEKASAAEVLDLLNAGHILHLPVVDHEGRLRGMIERRHALAGYLETTLIDRVLPNDYPEVG